MVSLGHGQCWGLSPNKDLPLLTQGSPPFPRKGFLSSPRRYTPQTRALLLSPVLPSLC